MMGGKLVDRARGFWLVSDTEAEHRDIAEPEREAGDEADFRDVDRGQPPRRINAVTHRAAGKHARADVMADRVAGEPSERCDAIGDVVRTDRAQREQIVEGEREIAGRDEQRGEHEVPGVGRLERHHDIGKRDAAQHAIEHHPGRDDDDEAEGEADLVPTDLLIDKPRGRAEWMEHSFSLGSVSATLVFLLSGSAPGPAGIQ